MNRKDILENLFETCDWKGTPIHYRDKRGCIIYLSEQRDEIYIDVPFDQERLYSDTHPTDGKKANFNKTYLPFTMADYLRVSKVLLRKNKTARRWFNQAIKNNFKYEGRLFREYFLPDGNVNWELLLKVSDISIDQLVFIMKCDGIDWKGYDPLWNCKEYQENK